MKIVLLLSAIAVLTACAGSKVDTDFRRKVKSDTVTVQGQKTGDGFGGTITNTIEFRDPGYSK